MTISERSELRKEAKVSGEGKQVEATVAGTIVGGRDLWPQVHVPVLERFPI